MPTVIWSKAALADLDRQYQFLKSQNPEAAVRALQAIVEAGKNLARTPQRGAPIASALTRVTEAVHGRDHIR